MMVDVGKAIGDLRAKRVLVTGGSGVIGRELLAYLQTLGSEVLSVDRVPLDNQAFPGISTLVLDLADDDLTALERFDPDVVIHLAASFERARETPGFFEENWHDNAIVTHRLAKRIGRFKSLETIVFASSYLAYCSSLYMFETSPVEAPRLREGDQKAPRNLCGAAKFYAEKELDCAAEVFDPEVRIVHARICRVYGHGSNDVVSRWIRAMLNGERIEAYNTDNQFDYIHARDVAQGLLRLAVSTGASGPINLGSGRPRKVRELLSVLQAATGIDRTMIDDRGDIEAVEASCLDLTKLVELTGWRPAIELEDGVRDVIEYERQLRKES